MLALQAVPAISDSLFERVRMAVLVCYVLFMLNIGFVGFWLISA